MTRRGRYGSANIEAACAQVATGRPTESHNATASSSSSTLVGLLGRIEVLLETDVEMTAELERELRDGRL